MHNQSNNHNGQFGEHVQAVIAQVVSDNTMLKV